MRVDALKTAKIPTNINNITETKINLSRLLKKLNRSNNLKCIFDIGANKGIYSILSRKISSSAEIFVHFLVELVNLSLETGSMEGLSVTWTG